MKTLRNQAAANHTMPDQPLTVTRIHSNHLATGVAADSGGQALYVTNIST